MHGKTDPSGATSTYTYNAVNWVTQQDDRAPGGILNVAYTFAYDANGNKTSETEARPGKPNRITTNAYNKANWLVATTDPGGGTTTYNYDAAGNRTSTVDPLGITTAVTYNALNLPAQTTHSTNPLVDTTTNTYDARQNLQTAVTVEGNLTLTTTATYNANNYLTRLVASDRGVGGSQTTEYNLGYYDNNLLAYYGPVLFGYNYVVMYDAANRVNCFQNGGYEGPVWFAYYPDGNRRYTFDGYNPIRSCAVTADPGGWFTARRAEYSYTGEKLTRRELRPYGDLSALYVLDTYGYDNGGNLREHVKVDYTTGTTTTVQYAWTYQAGAYRLTSFTASNGITTTLDYDALGRIQRRYTAQGYSDYTYEDGTNWLLRETWRSAISGQVFDLVRYRYTNGRPSYIEFAYGLASDLSAYAGYDLRYLQYNWHGDAVIYVDRDGAGGEVTRYDPWGNWPPATPTRWNYYRWNGAWGYLYFQDLGLYYVHGRWYNPDTGMFLSPDANGSYQYNARQDAVNHSWLRRQPQQSLSSDECSTPYYYAPKFAGGRLMNFCVAGIGACDKYYDELVEILTMPWRIFSGDYCLPGDLGCWGGAGYARFLERTHYDLSPFLYVPRFPEAVDPWDSPNGSKDLTVWLIQQCNTNAQSVYACAMRRAINRSAVLGTAQSSEMWYDLVNTGHVWDFKPAIQRKFGGSIQLTGLWFGWDVPANIHYGFVGRASGFNDTILLVGAGIAQIRAGTSKPAYWSSWLDDPKDQIAIRVGMELYDETKGNLTVEALRRKLLQYRSQLNTAMP